MATASSTVATSVDVLSSAERKCVERGLEALAASAKRSMNSEKNFEIKELRAKELAFIEALIVKFR